MKFNPQSKSLKCPFSAGKMVLREVTADKSDFYFVSENSIVREIWGKSDTVLFIFAGASAEFALNKSVDWLYFTGNLPNDPIGRLFSTVEYARKIVFASEQNANSSIDIIREIHTAVEKNRGFQIPDWAYRDVLYMLIYYSVSSYELLEKKLTHNEKEEVYKVFYRVGKRMGLQELPENYEKWLPSRECHLQQNLVKSDLTTALFRQYKKHLGNFRFQILLESQKLVIPAQVKNMLNFNRISFISPAISIYKWGRKWNFDVLIKNIILPAEYKNQINALNINPKQAIL